MPGKKRSRSNGNLPSNSPKPKRVKHSSPIEVDQDLEENQNENVENYNNLPEVDDNRSKSNESLPSDSSSSYSEGLDSKMEEEDKNPAHLYDFYYNFSNLQELYLEDFEISEEEVDSLLTAIRNNSNITGISLINCDITDDLARKIVEEIKGSEAPISSLNFSSNNITNEGVKTIAQNIALTKIKKIDLSYNNLVSDAFFWDLFEDIFIKSEVENIDLEGNNLDLEEVGWVRHYVSNRLQYLREKADEGNQDAIKKLRISHEWQKKASNAKRIMIRDLDDSSDEEEVERRNYNRFPDLSNIVDSQGNQRSKDWIVDNLSRLENGNCKKSFIVQALGRELLYSKDVNQQYYPFKTQRLALNLNEWIEESIQDTIERVVDDILKKYYVLKDEKSGFVPQSIIQAISNNILNHRIENYGLSIRDFFFTIIAKEIETNEANLIESRERIFDEMLNLHNFQKLKTQVKERLDAEISKYIESIQTGKKGNFTQEDVIEIFNRNFKARYNRETLPELFEFQFENNAQFRAAIRLSYRSQTRQVRNLQASSLGIKHTTVKSFRESKSQNRMVSKETMTVTSLGKRTDFLLDAGEYGKIFERIQNLKEIMGEDLINDKIIAQLIRARLNGNLQQEMRSRNYLTMQRNLVGKFIKDFTVLLFSTEVTRNPSCLIINQMMLDLIINENQALTWENLLIGNEVKFKETLKKKVLGKLNQFLEEKQIADLSKDNIDYITDLLSKRSLEKNKRRNFTKKEKNEIYKIFKIFKKKLENNSEEFEEISSQLKQIKNKLKKKNIDKEGLKKQKKDFIAQKKEVLNKIKENFFKELNDLIVTDFSIEGVDNGGLFPMSPLGAVATARMLHKHFKENSNIDDLYPYSYEGDSSEDKYPMAELVNSEVTIIDRWLKLQRQNNRSNNSTENELDLLVNLIRQKVASEGWYNDKGLLRPVGLFDEKRGVLVPKDSADRLQTSSDDQNQDIKDRKSSAPSSSPSSSSIVSSSTERPFINR